MNAQLYISDETFKYNGIDSLEDISKKIAEFSELVNFVITNNKGDSFLVRNNQFYSVPILNDEKTLYDVLYNKDFDNLRDIRNLLMSCLSNFINTEESLDGFYKKLSDNTTCSAIVVLNKFENEEIPSEKQIISTKDDWYAFHRSYLYLNLCNEIKDFLNELPLYFEKLILHEDNEKTIKTVYSTHLKQIVTYLGYLNDHLLEDFKLSQTSDFLTFLKEFSIKYNIDDASFEGTKKTSFKKSFFINGKIEEKYCEPHLKMLKNDKNEANKHCRIYFATVKKEDKFIYIGIIKNHI